MSKVALCYRPEDCRDAAARLCEYLAAGLGASRLVRDTASLEQAPDCDVVVVIIGEGWLAACDPEGRRRLADPADPVRAQIERALGAGAAVIPVLLGRTRMPQPQELPPSLAELSFQNGMRLRADPDFRKDAARLLRAIRTPALRGTLAKPRGTLAAALARGRDGAVAGALLGAAGVVVCLALKADRELSNVLLSAWPLVWLAVWWRKRRGRAALQACFLLPFVLAPVMLIAASGFLLFAIVGDLLLPEEQWHRLVHVFVSILWCASCGGATGAVLGAAASARRAGAIRAGSSEARHATGAVRRAAVLGGLLGCAVSSAPGGAVVLASPEMLTVQKPFIPPALFVIEFLCFPASVVLLGTLAGLVGTALERRGSHQRSAATPTSPAASKA
jgi:hypothetical protein